MNSVIGASDSAYGIDNGYSKLLYLFPLRYCLRTVIPLDTNIHLSLGQVADRGYYDYYVDF